MPSADPTVPDQQLDGKSRVNGIALGATGHITPAWTLQTNYTWLDSKVLRSIAKNSPAGTVDPVAGNPLTATPKNSGSVWTAYDFPFGLQLGYGFTYTDGFLLNNGAAPRYKTDSYWVHRAMAAYSINDAIRLQLNVQNIFDKTYYTRVRNNGWAVPGAGRQTTLSAVMNF